MSGVVSTILQWLNENPELAGLATFLISAGESVAVIGTIVPGSVTMTAIGALAGAGIIPLWSTLLWATLGAIVGDGISYWMGHYFQDRIRRMWPFKDNPGILEKGEVFVHKYGVMSVFIGRFVGPVRALVPVVAGMLGMKPLQFTIANVTSAIGWAPAYMLPGLLLGAASLELPPDIALHVILVLFLILLFIMLCLWLIYKLLQLISQQTDRMLDGMWNALKKSRYFHITTIILKHYDPEEHHGQLTLVFYFLLISALFVSLVAYVKVVGAQNIFINDAFFHLFRGIRKETLDHIMICITLLGQKQIILSIVVALFIWLLIIKRSRAAFHVLGTGIIAAGSIFMIKHLVKSPRPWGIFNSPDSFSMPSGHAVLSATIYLGIAFMIASPMPKKRRWLIYTPAIIITLLIGTSRVYLGAHWATDVFAAWLLSGALLILIILSYHRKREEKINLWGISIVSLLALSCSYFIYYHTHITQITKNYSRIDWPTSVISLDEWWQYNRASPIMRVSLFGFPSQFINIQWLGDLQEIKKTLTSSGWQTPPTRNWISTLHRISDIKSSQYLP